MNDSLKEKIETLTKSMYRNVKKAKNKHIKKVKEKDAIKDLFDKDRVAEMSPDDVPANKTSTLNKGKSIEKHEEFVFDFLNKFEKISKAYLMEKAKIDDLEPNVDKKKQERKERNKDFQPKKKEKWTKPDEKGNKFRSAKFPKESQGDLKRKLKDKPKTPSRKDLEYPMAASEDS